MNKQKLFNFYCKFIFGLNLIKLKLTNSRAPLMANLIITNRCNLECFYCYVDVFNPDRQHLNLQEKRVITGENLIELVDTLYDRGCRLIVLLGGEPLMFKEIGGVIRHIKSKKMVCEIITNGYLVDRYLDDLALCDSVCVSLDGEKEGNDLNRGRGSFQKAVDAISLLLKHQIPVRVKAVLTHNNKNSLDFLGSFAKEQGVMLTVSVAATYDDRDYHQKDKWLEEYSKKNFLDDMLNLKKKGIPIGYSMTALDYMQKWPYDEDFIIKGDKSNHTKDFDLIRCKRKDNSLFIDADGEMYPCAFQWGKNSKNVFEGGFDAAWEHMPKYDCYACGSLPDIDVSLMFNFNLENIINAAKFYTIKRNALRKSRHTIQSAESVR